MLALVWVSRMQVLILLQLLERDIKEIDCGGRLWPCAGSALRPCPCPSPATATATATATSSAV